MLITVVANIPRRRGEDDCDRMHTLIHTRTHLKSTAAAVAATAAIIIAAVIADSVMSSATSTAAVKLAERGQPTRATSLKSGSASRQGQ